MSAPRVVFGLPAFERSDTFRETLESLLGQTSTSFAVHVVDDSRDGALEQIAGEYMGVDARVTYERNPVRIGMVANWRRCFERARELYPSSEFFAWVSDHDVWHPRWLQAMLHELEAHSEVVAAYPVALRTLKSSRPVVNRPFDTFGVTDPIERLRLCSERMIAGNVIYGLFRADALERAGVFPAVLMPDRQVLLALSLLGQFKQVPELLWYREIKKSFSIARQRTSLFAGRPPWHAYAPTHVVHAALLLWDFAVRGRGVPTIKRSLAVRAAAVQLSTSLTREFRTGPKDVTQRKFGWLRGTHPAESAGG